MWVCEEWATEMGRGRIWVTDCAVRGEARKGTTGRREEGKNLRIYQLFQIRTKIAHNKPHTPVCSSMCDFENVLFSKENRTHKSHKFAQCKQNDHAYCRAASTGPPSSRTPTVSTRSAYNVKRRSTSPSGIRCRCDRSLRWKSSTFGG